MATQDPERLEALLADALAVHDERGQAGLDAFLREHAADRAAIERGLARCRQLGMLGEHAAPARDFPERLGEFRLLRRLGGGGMGVVYEAEQQSLGRRVALKVVRPELLYFEGARERFRREIEAVARLAHPAVVPVLASGEQDGVPWYAMELLPGRTVNEVCEALAGRDPAALRGEDLRAAIGPSAETGTDPLQGPWWQACVRIAHTVALGVRHAHLRGIVHRDIKPSNVMLTPDGRAVLLDFGVAMLGGGRELTRTGATPGSPAFMSPEQLRGDAVDERTDVYSLAATLWSMLTLRPPFRGVDLQAIRDGDLAAASLHNREVPRELVVVLQKALDRDRERRYADVEQFAQDLVAVLHRLPIRARRLDPSLRAWRWCQRHRVAATACASLLLASLSLPAVLAWRERATNERLALAAALAQQGLTTALDAIGSLLVRVADDRLRHVPGASQVAEQALADAIAKYDELLRDHPDHVRLHVDAGKAVSRHGDYLVRRGAFAAACDGMTRAIAQLGGDRTDVPPEWLETRSVLRTNLGSWSLQAGRRDDAVGAFAAAQRDLDALAVAAGASSRFELAVLRGRAELSAQRAGLHDPLLDADAMERECREAVELARALHARTPSDPFAARQLVERLDTLATALGKRRRHGDALPLLDEALALARAIPADTTFWPPQPLLVAHVLETLGNLHVEQRDARAPAALQECLRLRERAAADHPEDASLRCELAAALHNLAVMSFFQAQDDLALERVDRALALQRDVVARMPGYGKARDYLRRHLVHRGTVLASLRRGGDLHALLGELGAIDEPSAQRSAARLWCRLWKLVGDEPAGSAPSRAQCADAALAALQRADELGWGAGNPFGDAVYAPLRGRPEFDALVARVAARARPTAEDAGAGAAGAVR